MAAGPVVPLRPVYVELDVCGYCPGGGHPPGLLGGLHRRGADIFALGPWATLPVYLPSAFIAIPILLPWGAGLPVMWISRSVGRLIVCSR